MPISTFTEYQSKITTPFQYIQDTKTAGSQQIGRAQSLWRSNPFPGAIPLNPEQCDNTMPGCIGQVNSDGVQRLAQVAVSLGNSGYIIIADRLVHSASLSGTSTAVQHLTGMPSLPRYQDGIGVMGALEIYVPVGITEALATVTYTNHLDVSGRTVEIQIGVNQYNNLNRMLFLPMAQGDLGIKSVESVHLSTSTGTAGDFGVTLFKPLYYMPVPNLGSQQFLYDSILNMCGNMPVILNNACLFYISVGNNAIGVYQSAVRIIEETP